MTSETSLGGSGVHFCETSWSVVLQAKRAVGARDALDHLIRTYWKPSYFFLRRRGLPIEEAKDITQAFFAEFLERDFLRSVSSNKGKFRTFVLAALTHFLSKADRHDGAMKRGGRARHLDIEDAEIRCSLAHDETPERAFNRDWAATLIQHALHRIREQSRDPEVSVLVPYLTRGTRHYRDLARQLRCSEREIAKRVFMLRARLRSFVEDEVRATTAGDQEFREEIGDLCGFL